MKGFDRFRAFATLYTPDSGHQFVVLACVAGRPTELAISYQTSAERMVSTRATIALELLSPVASAASIDSFGVTVWRIPTSLTAVEFYGAHVAVTAVISDGTVLQRNIPLTPAGASTEHPAEAGIGRLQVRCRPEQRGLALRMTLQLTGRLDPMIHDSRLVLRRQSQVIAVRRLADLAPLALNAIAQIVRLRDHEMRLRSAQGNAPVVADDEMASLMENPEGLLSWLPPRKCDLVLAALADVAREGGTALQKSRLLYPAGGRVALALWQAAVPALTLARLGVEELAEAGLLPLETGAHSLAPLVLQEADSLQIEPDARLGALEVIDALNDSTSWVDLSTGLTLIVRGAKLEPETLRAPESAHTPPESSPQTGDPELIAAVWGTAAPAGRNPAAELKTWLNRWIVALDGTPEALKPEQAAAAETIAPGTQPHSVLVAALQDSQSGESLLAVVDRKLAALKRPLRRLGIPRGEAFGDKDGGSLESVAAAIVVLADTRLAELTTALQRADIGLVVTIVSEILAVDLEDMPS